MGLLIHVIIPTVWLLTLVLWLHVDRTCIERQFKKWNKASAISGIFYLLPETADLWKCITTNTDVPACSKFEFIANFVCDLKKTKTVGVSRSENPRGYSRHVFSLQDSLTQSQDQVSVVMAHYGTHECLICFVAIHTIRFISTKHKYVWMELIADPWDCKCGTISLGTFVHMHKRFDQYLSMLL